MKSRRDHWDDIFSTTEETQLGWYEKDTAQTFKLLHEIPDWQKTVVFLSGAGTSILVDDLFPLVNQLVLNDISSEALNHVRERLKKDADKAVWCCQDIAKPFETRLPDVDIWIDRAVLHFLTREDEVDGYFDNLKAVLKPGGHAIFAEFSLLGAPKCAGLTLRRYSVDQLMEQLGSAFELVSHFDYTYTNPFGGTRPFIYALFKRVRELINE